MPTDLTGTPTSLGIGTYNVDADAPSGLGFNAAMAQIDALIASRIGTPAGITSGEIPVWNGSTWVRSLTQRPGQSSLGTGTPGIATFLRGDGAWQKGAMNLLYDTSDAGVVFPAASFTTPTLDQSFAHLLCLWNAKTGAGAFDSLCLQVNGDTTANYHWQNLGGANTTVSALQGSAATFIQAGFLSQNNGFTSSGFFVIPNYSDASSPYMPLLGLSLAQTATTPTFQVTMHSGLRKTGAAITTLKLFALTGPSIGVGRFSIYGIPG